MRLCVCIKPAKSVSRIANLPRGQSSSQLSSHRRACFQSSCTLLTTLQKSEEPAPSLFRRTRAVSAWRASLYPGHTILEILGEISLDRCLELSLVAAAGSTPSTSDSTLFLPTIRETHVVSLWLARAVPIFARDPPRTVNFVECRHCL
jgi:hypothetical protein